MPGEFRCACGGRVAVPDAGAVACPGCGRGYAVAPAVPDVLWRDDPTAALALSSADGATKRPGPLPVGQPVWAPPNATMRVFDRLADRAERRPRGRKRMRQALTGGGLLALATLIYQYQLDLGFLHLGTLVSGVAGLVYLFQAMLGNDR